MARVATLRERVAKIKRKYKKVSPQKFFYNKKSDLKKRFKRIQVWYLIHDETRGYSIIRLEFKRKELHPVSTWARMQRNSVGKNKRTGKPYPSLYSVFTQAILPAINNKGGNLWRFISLLGWTGLDLYQPEDTKAPRRRNKTT